MTPDGFSILHGVKSVVCEHGPFLFHTKQATKLSIPFLLLDCYSSGESCSIVVVSNCYKVLKPLMKMNNLP